MQYVIPINIAISLSRRKLMPVKDKKVTLKKKNVSNTGAKNKKSQKKLKAPVKKKLSDKTSSKTKALKKETSSKKTVVKAKKPIASKVKTTQKNIENQ